MFLVIFLSFMVILFSIFCIQEWKTYDIFMKVMVPLSIIIIFTLVFIKSYQIANVSEDNVMNKVSRNDIQKEIEYCNIKVTIKCNKDCVIICRDES